MRHLPQAYIDAKNADHQSIILSVITTIKGRYIYSDVFPTDAIRDVFGSVDFWNGADATLGDGGFWGAIPVIEFGARLLTAGSLKETLVPQNSNLLISLTQSERGSVTTSYDNLDHYFSELLGDHRDEPFLAQQHEIYHGFVGLSGSDFIRLFSGKITQIRNSKPKFQIISEAINAVSLQIETEAGLTAYALETLGVDTDTFVLIHSDTTDGSSVFTDSSTYGRTINISGTVEHKTAQQKFGTSSIAPSSGVSQYLYWNRMEPGTGDFTVDFWIYLAGTAFPYPIFQTAHDPMCVSGFYSSQTGIRVACGASGAPWTVQSDSFTFLNRWTHIAVIRESGVLKLYFDGILKDSAANTHNLTGGSDFFRLGATNASVGTAFNGYWDEIRGSTVARWSANFTPPTAPYGVANPIMARDTFTHAALASVFFAGDNWTCNINLTKVELGDAGILFELSNDGTETTLEIGIDANNFAYVKTGQDIEGTPAVTTYTDTQALTASMIAENINLFIRYNDTDSEITFRINGFGNTQAAAVPYDRTGTNDERITLGDDFSGTILNLKFNTTFFVTNNLGDDTLVSIPDVIGGHDLTVVNGSWEAW